VHDSGFSQVIRTGENTYIRIHVSGKPDDLGTLFRRRPGNNKRNRTANPGGRQKQRDERRYED